MLAMTASRFHHVGAWLQLPDASMAVFFLAGALLRPVWMLPLLLGLVSALDLIGLASGSISDWCLSPAYWTLALAHAVLWLGGRLSATPLQRDAWLDLPRLLGVLLLSGSVAYLLSEGGFYSLSGRYPQVTLGGFLARVSADYPRALGTLAGDVGIAFAVLAAGRSLAARPLMGERA
nr:hypothetical protein [Xanthomonas cucurbitae]